MSIPRSNGHLPQATIERVLGERRPAIERCYLDLVGRNPSARGSLEIRMTIAEDGLATRIRSSSKSMPDDAFLCCIDTALAGIKFPAPKGGDMTLVHGLDLDH